MDERSQRVRFVILGLQRSGTSVTQVALAGHPNVSMAPSEILGPFYQQGIGAFTGGKESFAIRKATYLPLFDAIAGVFANESSRAIGFKAAVGNHETAIELTHCLREYLPDVKVILVHRDDLVAQLASFKRASRTGVWHAWEGSAAKDTGKVRIDRNELRDYAVDCKRALAELRSIGETHDLFELNYERDIMPGTGYTRAFGFLQVEEIPVSWLRMKKLNPQPEEFIADYAKLRAFLDGISDPSREELEEIAREKLLEKSRTESFGFLVFRALDRLWRGLADEANSDVRIALAKGEGVPQPSPAGRVYGLLEDAAPDARRPDELRATLTELDQLAGENAYFRLNRGQIRLAKKRLRPAHDDFVAALMGQPELDSDSVQAALDGIEQAWLGLEDIELARETLATLSPRHGEGAGYLTLHGVFLCHTGDRAAGMAMLERASHIDRSHPRLVAALEAWATQ